MTIRRRSPSDQRGFALLLVLWSLVLLSLIIGHILATGRRETQLAYNLRQAAIAQTVADSAVQDTIYRLLTQGPPKPSSRPVVLRLPGGVAEVRLRDLAGMVNPNMAPAPLLAAMLKECGASGATAARIAQSLADWRSPSTDRHALVDAYRAAGRPYAPLGQPFQAAEEIALVAGMTPGLAACLRPHISVYGDQEIPVAALADPVVTRALSRMIRDTGQALPLVSPNSQGSFAVAITAEARSTGAHFLRETSVRIDGGDATQPYRILTWSDGR